MVKNKISNRFTYTEKQMKDAVAAVKAGVPQRIAAAKYNVPRATLFDKVKGRTQIERKMGRYPYLTENEEQEIVE